MDDEVFFFFSFLFFFSFSFLFFSSLLFSSLLFSSLLTHHNSEALDVDEHEPPRVVVGEWRRSGKGVESNPKRKTEGEESEGMESEGGVDLGELITQNRTGEGAEEEVLLMVTSSQLYRVEGNKPTFFLTQG